MGANPTLKNLTDLERHGAFLRVTCPGCRRSVAFDPKGVIGYFRSKGLNTA
jgi:hypothetical protein